MSVDALVDALAERVAEAARSFGGIVESGIRDDLDNPPPSEPGEKPGKRSGALQAATVALPVERNGDVVSVSVTNTAEHAAYLEYGTDRMAARPFMRPAFERYSPLWADHLKQSATSGPRRLT